MKRNAIAVLNEIARIELSGPKRHRHDWQTNQRLERGTTVLFICAACPKTKTVRIPTIEERKAELRKRWSK
jgi:hypothetical protein